MARFDSTVGGQPAAGVHLTRNVELVAEHNVVDSGDLSGTWSFRVVTVADADEDDRDSTDYQDNDAYSAISLPSLPVTVTGDDEPTEVFIESADTTDNIATEGDTSDTAKFKVRLSRALEAGEWVEVPLASRGAELSTHFTLALDGTPSGVAYADSSDGTLGLVRFTGPSVNEATVVVTAASDDGNSVTENMLVHTYRTSEPSQRLRIDTNLDEVCSGEGCGPGRYGERVYRVTLQEASDGLRIIDHGDGRLVEAPDDDTSTYEYEVRLNTAPANNVTLTTTTSDTARTQIASDKGTLTFTPSNWDTEQTMRVFARGNNTDEADQPFTVTHAFSGDVTYAALPAATHDLVFVDNDATTVTMAGTGVRTSSSGTEISEVMVEGDASRVDRSLTVSLSRALEAGEYVRVPLYLEAVGHSLNPRHNTVRPDQHRRLARQQGQVAGGPDRGVQRGGLGARAALQRERGLADPLQRFRHGRFGHGRVGGGGQPPHPAPCGFPLARVPRRRRAERDYRVERPRRVRRRRVVRRAVQRPLPQQPCGAADPRVGRSQAPEPRHQPQRRHPKSTKQRAGLVRHHRRRGGGAAVCRRCPPAGRCFPPA